MAWASSIDRLGIPRGPGDPRLAWRLVAACALLYLVSFALFYPRVATNTDEAMYIRQTELVLLGTASIVNEDPLTGEQVEFEPSTYTVGTPMLMAPFVALFGWRGAYVVPVLGLLMSAVFMGRWLQDAGRSPLYALLVFGFPPALVMGRVAMSDAPSVGVVALGLWLFWRGIRGRSPWWLAAGFVAGASTALRLTNALVFAPLFAGTVLRREAGWWALLVGGLAGLAVRALAMQAFFGDAAFERGIYYFEPETIGDRIPLFLVGLMVFVPGGLLLVFLNRGPRWPELCTSVVLFLSFYLFQKFSSIEVGFWKRVVLGLRYCMPLLPVVVFAMTEPLERYWEAARARLGAPGRRRLEAWVAALLIAWVAGIGLASAVVHPAFASWSATQAELREAIYENASLDQPLVTNWNATRKFLRDLERRYLPLDSGLTSAEQVEQLLERHGVFTLALLDRTDSEWWREKTKENDIFLAELDRVDASRELLYDRRVTASDHLRIWRVSRVPAAR